MDYTAENKFTLFWLDSNTLEINNENMELRAACSRVINEKQEKTGVWPHDHIFFEMQYVLNGRIVFLLDNKIRVSVEQGNFIVVPPRHKHHAEIIDENTVKYVLGFYIKPRKAQIENAVVKVFKKLYTVYSATDYMENLVNMMWSTACELLPLTKITLEKLLECFIIEAFRVICPGYDEKEDFNRVFDNDMRIELMGNYIARNINNPITVKEIAAHLNICERHINRIAQNYLGYTVKEVIDRKKNEYIKDLLTTSVMPISKIAEMSGFSSSDAMSRFFNRMEKCTPAKFRNNQTNASRH